MLSALKKEIRHNITQLGEYTSEITGSPSLEAESLQENTTPTLPILKDEAFRKMQQVDFHSKGLTDQDRDMLDRIFTLFSRRMVDISDQDRKKICMENMRKLEEILTRITDYIKGKNLR